MYHVHAKFTTIITNTFTHSDDLLFILGGIVNINGTDIFADFRSAVGKRQNISTKRTVGLNDGPSL